MKTTEINIGQNKIIHNEEIQHEKNQEELKINMEFIPVEIPKVEIPNIEPPKVDIIDKHYPNTIQKLYHISDTHINLYSRHIEYREVFQRLYIELKKEQRKDNSLIVLTGDILHSKTELSPECIRLTIDFFTKLSDIMNVVIIAGNHDANLSNMDRLDSISPMVDKLENKHKVFYLKDTGVYRFNNILFSVASIFDYNVIPAFQVPDIKGCLKIALFHGRVNGALLYNGIRLSGEINHRLGKTITPSTFKGYDYVLMGDIHKHQFLDNKYHHTDSVVKYLNIYRSQGNRILPLFFWWYKIFF